jgi:hypothetical protein
MLATMTNLATPPMLAKTTNLARPTDAAIRSTYRSYSERSADRGLNGAASALLFGEMLPKALPALGGYNVSFFVEVASRRAKCEKVKKKAVYYKVLFNIDL